MRRARSFASHFRATSFLQNRINPGMKAVVDKLMPRANRPGLTNNFLQTEGAATIATCSLLESTTASARNDVIWGRMLRQKVGELTPAGSALYVSENRYDVQNYGAGWNHIFGPSTVLEARYGFNNPNNPGCPVFRNGLTRAGVLSARTSTLFDTAALCDTQVNFARRVSDGRRRWR